MLSPKEIAELTVETGVKKANLKWWKQFILGILAGLFIAMAANAASVVGYTADSAGMAKMLSGSLFGTGLIMVLLAGAELFTGNCLMSMAVAEKRIRLREMLRNWFFVFIGNMIGPMIYTFLVSLTSQMSMDGGLLGAYTFSTAYTKCTIGALEGFIHGLFCNILVCTAVFISYASRDIVGKIAAMFFPIWIFVVSGYEHCVANMYFIPMAIFSLDKQECVDAAMARYGLTAEQLEQINFENFFFTNLLPVTLGNVVGGVLCVGLVYWLVYVRENKEK